MPLLLKTAWHQVQVGRSRNRKPSTDLGGWPVFGMFLQEISKSCPKNTTTEVGTPYPSTKPHQTPQTEVKRKNLGRAMAVFLKHIHDHAWFSLPRNFNKFHLSNSFCKTLPQLCFPTEKLFTVYQPKTIRPPNNCAFFRAQKPIATGRSCGT